jgi:hypothetical protein
MGEIIYFTHELLTNIFESGIQIRAPVTVTGIKVYDGSISKCGYCEGEKSAYFYIDAKLRLQWFLCSKCMNDITEHRGTLINKITENKELEASQEHKEEKSAKEKELMIKATTSNIEYTNEELTDIERDSGENTSFIILECVSDAQRFFLLSFDELMGDFADQCDNMGCLDENGQYEHDGLLFRLPEHYE